MRARATIIVVAALAACTPPGPDANNLANYAGDLAEQLCDPASMQLRNVQVGPEQVSGYVRARMRDGGDAGSMSFTVDRRTGHAVLGTNLWAGACPSDAELNAMLGNGQ